MKRPTQLVIAVGVLFLATVAPLVYLMFGFNRRTALLLLLGAVTVYSFVSFLSSSSAGEPTAGRDPSRCTSCGKPIGAENDTCSECPGDRMQSDGRC